MDIKKIKIESEGEHNGYFTIFFTDGTVRSGWSCDQGSIEMDDDKPLSDELAKACFDAWFAMPIDDEFDGRHFATWTPKSGLGKTTKEIC